MTNEKKIICIIIIFIFGILITGTIISSIQSYNTRRLYNQLRERIIDTENTNKELAGTIGQCKSISRELGESVERNISSARDAIELIEQIRIQVQNLEMVTGDWNPDNYYNYLDSYCYSFE